MAATKHNRFEFMNAENDSGTTVLNAVMSDFSYAKHAHEELALGVTTSGVQEFDCEGSQFRSHAGDIILFNPGDVHNGNPGDDEALKYTMIYLDIEDFYPLIRSSTEGQSKQFRISENHFKDPVLQFLILEMAQVVADGRRMTVEYEHCRYKIAKQLAKRLRLSSADSWVGNKDTLLLKVRDYIHDNIKEDISIEELSQVANISKYHFIRLFRNQFGMTPHKYILNSKVNRARVLLKSGILSSAVAHELGFFDVSHLNRHFKRSFGLTPKQYQLQLKSQD